MRSVEDLNVTSLDHCLGKFRLVAFTICQYLFDAEFCMGQLVRIELTIDGQSDKPH